MKPEWLWIGTMRQLNCRNLKPCLTCELIRTYWSISARLAKATNPALTLCCGRMLSGESITNKDKCDSAPEEPANSVRVSEVFWSVIPRWHKHDGALLVFSPGERWRAREGTPLPPPWLTENR